DLRYGWWYGGWGQSQDGSADSVLGARERCVAPDESCDPGPDEDGPGRLDDPCAMFHFWSLHPGGANFLAADGPGHLLGSRANRTVAAEVEALGVEALPVQVDVRDEAQVEALAARTRERFGRIDILVNNAGAMWWQPVLQTPAKRFDLVMSVNARAAFLCSRA